MRLVMGWQGVSKRWELGNTFARRQMSTKRNVPEPEDECRGTSKETSKGALGGFCEVDIVRVAVFDIGSSKPCAPMELFCCCSEPDGVVMVLDLGLSNCPPKENSRGDLLVS